MRKYLFVLLLLSAVARTGYGQNIDNLFNEFRKEQNADYVNVSPFLMSFGKMFCGRSEEGEVLNKVKSVRVLSLDDCRADVKERFRNKADQLKRGGYEELIRVNDEEEKVRIWVKMKKETIRELLIVCSDSTDCTLVQINGRFSKNDIAQLVEMETDKKHGRRRL